MLRVSQLFLQLVVATEQTKDDDCDGHTCRDVVATEQDNSKGSKGMGLVTGEAVTAGGVGGVREWESLAWLTTEETEDSDDDSKDAVATVHDSSKDSNRKDMLIILLHCSLTYWLYLSLKYSNLLNYWYHFHEGQRSYFGRQWRREV